MSVAEKLEVAELLYRYAELIDAGDFDGVGELLGRATFGGPASGSVAGARTIAKLFAHTTRRFPDHGNTPRTRHLVLNPIIDIDGERATSRSTFCVVQKTDTVALQPSWWAGTSTRSPGMTRAGTSPNARWMWRWSGMCPITS
ncbi:small subunit of phenylpropionate dioxygenase [Mycolicibacterium conceptionense]|uniref:Small subunit of phenylpropionate dioxygenase n=1 Tax=Mycolicibacterium conceptionense TaxID=451644 RepID=A0A0U1D3S5_9MYCO|nr:small subunit of phenylpropionate dioxygenase [Mycolicibacterium conceptionense]